MTFYETLVSGEQGLFKPDTLTPMQKMILRFVVVGLVYYAFAVVEGMLMRAYEVTPLPCRAGSVLCHPDGPPPGRHLRLDLFHRVAARSCFLSPS